MRCGCCYFLRGFRSGDMEVLSLASSILQKLATTAYQDIASACHLKSDVEKLKKSMDLISKFLEDAENKQSREQSKPKDKRAVTESITEWLQQLKEAFEDASDILDEIEYEALQKQVVKENPSVTKKVRRLCSRSNPFAFHLEMSHKIKDIRTRVDTLTSYRERLGLKAIEHRHDNDQSLVQVLSWRETDSKLPFHMMGRYQEKEDIIDILMKPQSQANKIDVIPIVGIGGLGKTTLAQLVYNDKRIADHFMRLWVCVSNEFEKKRLIADILKAADKTKIERNSQNSNLEQLRRSFNEVLSGKKFLLVLDDVWNEDAKKWQELKEVLLALNDEGNKNDSKIIVTTRSHRVASVMGTVPAHKLGVLPTIECRKLFFKCAFPNGGEERHPTLVDIGMEIVNKCKGVPLIVITLGCLLCSNYDKREWEKIKNTEFWELEENGEESILPALRLSYTQLAPPQLKKCFSYCSLFPKDYLYNNSEMIPFWMGHGLLQPNNDKEEPEHIGESYIKKLLVKSLFQHQCGFMAMYDELVGNISVTMHDIIHDLALSVTRNEQAVVTSDCTTVHENVRHLSFWNEAFPIVRHEYPNKVRTINAQRMEPEDRIPTFLNWIVNEFKYLRVLDLAESYLEWLPDSLGKMKHLRYLCLRDCQGIKELPNSICDLHNLQCLNLGGCYSLMRLPKSMGRFLVSLRNFSITTQDRNLCYIDIGHFKCLQVLKIMDCDNLVSLPLDLWRLTTLKKLFIQRCPELVSFGDEDETGAKQGKLSLMKSLTLQMFDISTLPKLSVLPYWLTRYASDSLEVLSIIHCPAISSLPEEIVNLRKLEHFFVVGCPDLATRCRRDKGLDWSKIAHIPNIHVSAINGL